MQGDGGLAGGFGAVDLYDASPGHAADAQGHVQRHGTGGDSLHLHGHIFTQTHDGPLAVLFFQLLQGSLQGFLLIHKRTSFFM